MSDRLENSVDSEATKERLSEGSSGAPGTPTVPTRAQRIVGRIGQVCAVWWVVMTFMPTGGGESADWGELLILGGFFALIVAAPLWAVATGVRSAHRSTRVVCAWCALPGVVIPTFLIFGNWSTSTASGHLVWFAISGPVIATCLAIFAVTLVSEHRRGQAGGSPPPQGEGVNFSEPWTRWSVVAIVAVSIVMVILGVIVVPGDAAWFYCVALAVLFSGLLGVWGGAASGPDRTDPKTRASVVVITGAAIALVTLGIVSSRQPATETRGDMRLPNGEILSPDHVPWFYGLAAAVALSGLLGMWAASRASRRRGRTNTE
jgi:hypothetical protein